MNAWVLWTARDRGQGRRVPPRAGRTVAVVAAAAMFALALSASSAVSMLTYHNDNARLGLNDKETILTHANVNTNTFAKLFSHAVDGYVYTQPLYLAGVVVPAKGTHNVVYIATEHDSVYAFDADDDRGANAQPLWHVNFLNPALGITTVPPADTGETGDLIPEIGITSTPVIDPVSRTIFVCAKTKITTGGTAQYAHHLHALNIATGAEKFGGPVLVQAQVPGSGSGNDGQGHVPFIPLRELNRPGLLLLNGVVYLGFGSHGDHRPYHGWVLGYDALNLQQMAVYNTTPNGSDSAIWQAGGGLAADLGNIYVMTGNGTVNTNHADLTQTDLGDAFIKLSTAQGLAVVDYFIPHNEEALDAADYDLGSGGPILLPDEAGSGAHRHLLIGAGKEGTVYLLDRDNLGRFSDVDDSRIVQSVPGAVGGLRPSGVLLGEFGVPAYCNGHVYFGAVRDKLKSFRFAGGLLVTNPESVSAITYLFPGTSPSVSADGTKNAIVWALQNELYGSGGPAILHAYAASNLAVELYHSEQAGSRDRPGPANKFTVPTVVNGKVYVATQYGLSAYGLSHVMAPLALRLHPTNGGALPGLTHGQILEVGRDYTFTPKSALGLRFDGAIYADDTTGPSFDAGSPVHFRMGTGATLDLNFAANQLAPAAGTYYGLLLPEPDPADDTVGSPCRGTNAAYAQLTVTAAGQCSGKLTFPNTTVSFSAPLTAEGQGHVLLPKHGPLGPMNLVFGLSTLAPPLVITGRFNGPFPASLQASRAALTNPCAGRYTFFVPAPDHDDYPFPGGTGAGTVTITPAGKATVAGNLADASALSVKAPTTESGLIPFFARLYSGRGVFIGFARCGGHTNNDYHPPVFPLAVPELFWTKPPAISRPPFYPDGFRYFGELLASSYTPPPAGPSLLLLSNNVFVAEGGNLALPQVASLVYTNGKLTAPSLTNRFTLATQPATGRFTGSFRHPLTGKTTPFKGACRQLGSIINGVDLLGYGYFLGTNRAGNVQLSDE